MQELIRGNKYLTQYGLLTYMGKYNLQFTCDGCQQRRNNVYEFLDGDLVDNDVVNFRDYYHWGSECVKKAIIGGEQ